MMILVQEFKRRKERRKGGKEIFYPFSHTHDKRGAFETIIISLCRNKGSIWEEKLYHTFFSSCNALLLSFASFDIGGKEFVSSASFGFERRVKQVSHRVMDI